MEWERLLRIQRDLALDLYRVDSLNEAVRLCVHASMELAQMDSGGFYITNRDANTLDLLYSVNVGQSYLDVFSRVDAESPWALDLADGKPLCFNQERLAERDIHRQEGLKSSAIVPVMHDGSPVGCLIVASHTVPALPDHALDSLETIAAQIGSALFRFESEQALRDALGFVNEIISGAGEGIVVFDRELHIVVWNAFMERLTGWSEEQIKGEAKDELEGYLRARGTYERLNRALSGETFTVQDVPFEIASTGRRGYTTLVFAPHVNSSGDIVGVIETLQDVTQRKEVELKLQQTLDELERACSLQREFLSSVTHDVRTPLTAVQGYIEMLLEGMVGELTAEQSDILRRAMRSSEQLLRIVDSVLEVLRIRSGLATLNARMCNPMDFIEQAVTSIAPQAQKKGLTLRTHRRGKPDSAYYDQNKVVIILTNLLSNAVKYTDAGCIDIFTGMRRGAFEVIVADTGRGIDEADLPVIFEEFRQVVTSQGASSLGFGIGLAIVASAVETIGASLTVSSAKGLGTAFTLVIPPVNPGE